MAQRRKIEDGQTAMSEKNRRIGFNIMTRIIRSTMGNEIGCSMKLIRIMNG